ncbi:MAG: hypothetical protein AAFV77_08005 [Planctomycetota bacterium]
MSGIADSPIHVPCGAFQSLRFAERLARENEGERVERAAGRRESMVAAGEECCRSCPAPAARDEFTPRLADVSPVPEDGGTAPPREAVQITIQQLLPIGSIIDVTV